MKKFAEKSLQYDLDTQMNPLSVSSAIFSSKDPQEVERAKLQSDLQNWLMVCYFALDFVD